MNYSDKAKTDAQKYFSSFYRLFGQIPNFPSGEERLSALHSMTKIIEEGYQKYGNDPAVSRIIDCDVLDFMEELINTYK